MPVHCQECNSHFLLDGTTVAQGISCPDCGGTKLERDQPSPTHSDGELRNMVDPATQLDQGGNPLQEGIWAGVDNGWQPAYKRDEFFAKTANIRGPFDMATGEPYPLPGGGLGQSYACPNCGGQMSTTRGECFRCGYSYGREGESPITPQDMQENLSPPEDFLSPHGTPVDLGPVRHGRTASKIPPPSGIEPQHHDTVEPGEQGLHNRGLYWLGFLDASINGKPVREHQGDLFWEHGFPGQRSFGQPVTVSVHHPEHLAAAKEVIQTNPSPNGKELRTVAPTMFALGQAVMSGQVPPPPGITPRPQTPPVTPPVMSNHPYSRSLSQEPHLPWFHEAVTVYPAGGGESHELSTEDWANKRRERYRNQQAMSGHRLNWQPGQQGRGIMLGSQLHTWPIEKSNDNPQGGDMHGDYVSKLGINAANVDLNTGFDIGEDGSVYGNAVPPEVYQIDPNLHEHVEDWGQTFGHTKEGVAFLGPLAMAGGRMLLKGALRGLMYKAIGGAGNFLNQGQADEYEGQPGMNRSVGLVARYANLGFQDMMAMLTAAEKRARDAMHAGDSATAHSFGREYHEIAEAIKAQFGTDPRPDYDIDDTGIGAGDGSWHSHVKEALGVGAPVETPHSTPDLVEDHDPEAVDQQEFNDQDMSPAFNNPNNDASDGGLSQSTGEDGMKQKLEFREDGEGVSQAELLLPLIMEYVNSDKSALENPQLKALHETLEREIPNYLDMASDDDDAVHEFLEALKKPEGVHSKVGAPVYQNTPIPMGQMQMGQGQMQMPMPGTHQNPVGPGGMSVTGKCANCGSVTNADGSCPQCGASPGANQMGNMEQPGQQQTPIGIMPSPYAKVSEKLTPCPECKKPWDGLQCEHCGYDPNDDDFLYHGRTAASTTCPQCGSHELPYPTQSDPEWHECPQCSYTGIIDEFTHGQRGEFDQYADIQRIRNLPQVDPRMAADHQGPITPQQKEVFAEYLIAQNRQDEVAAMMANPGIYADEWAEYLNRQTQPPEVDPAEQAPQPQMDPSQMGQMPVPGMSVPPGGGMGGQMMAKTALSDRRCPECESATTNIVNGDGDMRCHRCGHVWHMDLLEDTPSIKSHWVVKSYQDALNDAPNPVAAPAAEQTAPGDREQQADSTLTWQSADGQPLQVGQVYEMHNPNYPIPDVVKVQAVKPDSITVVMEGEYNSPSDPQDANGPGYVHEINRQELETEGLTFNPVQVDGTDAEQSQDQADQDGVGQTVNTEPVEDPHGSFPLHAKALPTDHCPKCDYGHVTSSYTSPETVKYECYRCAHTWEIEDSDPGVESDLESRAWLNESSVQDEIGFDPRALAMAQTGKSRNIQDIAQKDPRLQQIKQVLNANKTAGAKFTPSEQKQFIDEDGVARNADLLNLDGTHYVSAFDNSKARPDRVNDNYLGMGL